MLKVSTGLFLIIFHLAGCFHAPRLQFPSPPAAGVEVLIKQARTRLHEDGDLAGAAKAAREVLRQDPASAPAHEVLALLAKLADDQPRSIKHWLAALADSRSDRVELYLSMLPIRFMGRGQQAELVALLEEISRKHPDPQSRAEALSALVQMHLRQGNRAAARATMSRRALITSWMGIAGFDNAEGKGYDTPYPPETEIDFARKYPGTRGQVGWRPIVNNGPEPHLELDQRFYPFSRNVAYLVTFIQSDRDQEVMLEISTTDPLKAWLNDRNVLAAREVRSLRHRQFRIPVKLHKGHNKLLIKSCIKSGQWAATVWFAGKDGTPLSLHFQTAPRPYTRDRESPVKWNPELALPRCVSTMKQGSERDLWAAVGFSAAGLLPSAIKSMSRYLDARPKDPVGLYYGALLHRAEGQLQKATQLIAQGLKLPAPHAARFWVAQARLFRERGQHDKAFEALGKARVMSPRGLQAAVQMDLLFDYKGWYLDRCRLARSLHAAYPDWGWPVGRLASCTSSLGRKHEANRWLRLAVRLNPRSEARRNVLVGSLLNLGQCPQALALQRESCRRWPERASPFLRLGDVLRRCGHPAKAIKAYDRTAATIPSWHLPLERKGLVHYERKEIKKALALWRQALGLNPDDTSLWDRVTHLRPDHDPILQKYRPGAAQIRAAVAASAQVKPVAGASIVWLLDHEVSRLMPDGTLKRVITVIRKAVDRSGRDSLGQMKLPRGGMVKVLVAYSVDPRGQRREVTSLHGRTVRYPALREGSVVVLQYRHVKRPMGYLRQHLNNTWLFQHNLEQVVRAEWILALPSDKKLNVDIQGKVEHRWSKNNDLTIHTFTSTDVPPLRPERNSPPASELLRLVSVGTVPSWDYFSEWGRTLTSEVFEMDPVLERALKQISTGKGTAAEKIRAVYHFALTRIRYQQDYETFLAGVKPHPASVVLSRGYGDCKDKSVLIIAMLRRLGYKANLALVRTRRAGKVRAKVPSQQFNHAVVYMPPQPGIKEKAGRFLDATAENLDIDVLRHDIQGTLSLVLFADGYRLIPIPYQAPEKNLSEARLVLHLAKDGTGLVELRWTIKGYMAGSLRKPLQNRQIQLQFGQMVIHKLYPECRMKQIKVAGQQTILRPLRIEMKLRCDTAARVEEKSGTIHLRLAKVFSEHPTNLGRWTERRHPLFFGPMDRAVSTLEVRLPEGVTMSSHPDALELKEHCLDFSGKWTRTATGPRYEQRFRRTCTELSAARYPQLQTAVGKLKRFFAKEVVMTLGKKKGAGKTRTKGKGKRKGRGKKKRSGKR